MKICPVCKKDEYTYLRCYRPDCTDGRYLIEDNTDLIKKLSKKNEELMKRLADK